MTKKNKEVEAQQNVTGSYKKNSVLWSKSKSLHRMGKIFSYYVSNGTVKIKIQETSQPLSIMHTSDLEKLFPDVDLSPTV